MNSDVLTVDEVAAKLRIGRRSAYRLVETGELKSIRVGRLIRIPGWALEQLIGPTSETPGGETGGLE
jgi:excisionase family DNA binding protein